MLPLSLQTFSFKIFGIKIMIPRGGSETLSNRIYQSYLFEIAKFLYPPVVKPNYLIELLRIRTLVGSQVGIVEVSSVVAGQERGRGVLSLSLVADVGDVAVSVVSRVADHLGAGVGQEDSVLAPDGSIGLADLLLAEVGARHRVTYVVLEVVGSRGLKVEIFKFRLSWCVTNKLKFTRVIG